MSHMDKSCQVCMGHVKRIDSLSQKHTNTHTHTHTLFLSHTHGNLSKLPLQVIKKLSPSVSPPLTQAHTLSYTHIHPLSHTYRPLQTTAVSDQDALFLFLFLSISHMLSRSLPHTPIPFQTGAAGNQDVFSLSLSLHTHTNTHTHSLSLSLLHTPLKTDTVIHQDARVLSLFFSLSRSLYHSHASSN